MAVLARITCINVLSTCASSIGSIQLACERLARCWVRRQHTLASWTSQCARRICQTLIFPRTLALNTVRVALGTFPERVVHAARALGDAFAFAQHRPDVTLNARIARTGAVEAVELIITPCAISGGGPLAPLRHVRTLGANFTRCAAGIGRRSALRSLVETNLAFHAHLALGVGALDAVCDQELVVKAVLATTML